MPVNIIKTEQFAELRQHNGYYVDKTGFLEEFLVFNFLNSPMYF